MEKKGASKHAISSLMKWLPLKLSCSEFCVSNHSRQQTAHRPSRKFSSYHPWRLGVWIIVSVHVETLLWSLQTCALRDGAGEYFGL